MSIQYLLPGLELTTFYYESPPVTTRQGLRPKDFFTRSFPASRGGGRGVTVFNPTLEDYHCAKFCRDRSGSFGFLYSSRELKMTFTPIQRIQDLLNGDLHKQFTKS